MPKRSAPTKSLALKVTRKSARLSTANSRTKSSFGSGRRGRQRKKMRRRFALAQRKRNTPSISLSLRNPPEQTRLSVCSYSSNSGTERLIRHRGSPASRNRRWDAPRLDSSAATSTLVSITTWYMIRYQHTEEMPRQSGRAAIAARCAQPAMKQWGYSVGYEHAHKFEDAITGMPCLPASLDGKRYYQPTD